MDEQFGYLLAPALSAYEWERVTGHAYGNEEFQQSIKQHIPVGHVFKVLTNKLYNTLPAYVAPLSMLSDTLFPPRVAPFNSTRARRNASWHHYFKMRPAPISWYISVDTKSIASGQIYDIVRWVCLSFITGHAWRRRAVWVARQGDPIPRQYLRRLGHVGRQVQTR
jgi:hypothetical protein